MLTPIDGRPPATTLRFAIKSTAEGLGNIVAASLHQGDHRLWLDAVFLPLGWEATLQQFREAARIVFPEAAPPTFPSTTFNSKGAR